MKAVSFCVKCQKDVEHDLSLDRNQEMVLLCACGSFLKLPALPPQDLKAVLEAHKKENVGRKFLNPVEEAKARTDSDAYLKSLRDAGIAK